MDRIKARTSVINRITEQIYRLEIQVVDGSIPYETDTIRRFVFNNNDEYDIPAYLVERSNANKTYYAFLNSEGLTEEEKGWLMICFDKEFFYFDLFLQPMFTRKANMRKIIMVMEPDAVTECMALSCFLFKKRIDQEIALLNGTIQPALKEYFEKNLCTPLTLFPDSEPVTSLQQFFANQWMGTYLFITGDWEFVKRKSLMACEVGYGENEIQLSGYGIKQKNVFCVSCCGLTMIGNEHDITCQHCGTFLDISDRYSKRYDAYLGFIYGGTRKGGA